MARRQVVITGVWVAMCVYMGARATVGDPLPMGTYGTHRFGDGPPLYTASQTPRQFGPKRPKFVEYVEACKNSHGEWNRLASNAYNNTLRPAMMRLMLADPSLQDRDKETLKTVQCHECAGGDDACHIGRVTYECPISNALMKATFVYRGMFEKDLMVESAFIHGPSGRTRNVLGHVRTRRLNASAYTVTASVDVTEVDATHFSVLVRPCEWCIGRYISCQMVTRVTWSPFAAHNLQDVVRLWGENRYAAFLWVYLLIIVRTTLCGTVLCDISKNVDWAKKCYSAVLICLIMLVSLSLVTWMFSVLCFLDVAYYILLMLEVNTL
ncbi:membrane protein A28 [Aotine betaherpesvirus 1]|uniref:Membrane protein A28 n=1 Tax=Aotine betaherpesvirus 1 TaxID=50290 RepID=G8XUK2_9BETA|nr:membrane protein A28 [Aotine betaherpesvirus 1]AEV80844.1 membrane protein A28 [Aotine betaherpesvirus 1]